MDLLTSYFAYEPHRIRSQEVACKIERRRRVRESQPTLAIVVIRFI
jgi:hypothetical protein